MSSRAFFFCLCFPSRRRRRRRLTVRRPLTWNKNPARDNDDDLQLRPLALPLSSSFSFFLRHSRAVKLWDYTFSSPLPPLPPYKSPGIMANSKFVKFFSPRLYFVFAATLKPFNSRNDTARSFYKKTSQQTRNKLLSSTATLRLQLTTRHPKV